MPASPEQRRLYYAIDPGYRKRRKNQALVGLGREPIHLESRSSWSRPEMLEIIGVSSATFTKYQQLGVIPLPTYPTSRAFTRYWSHQAVLLVRLFDEMRKEGWPQKMPHFIGSPYWTGFLERLRSDWVREPYDYREWKARGGDHQEGSDHGAGECSGV